MQDINVSKVLLFSMHPPYTPFAAESGPVLLRKSVSSAWQMYSLIFKATMTSIAGRVTWFFDNRAGLPDNADVWLGGASLLHVIPENPKQVAFESDVGNLLLWSQKPVPGEDPAPNSYGWKRWSQSDVKKERDFHLDPATKVLTTFCGSGPPSSCWPGGIEAALDITMVTLNSYVIVKEWDLRYGAAHGMNGGGTSMVVRDCDISW